MKKHLYFVLLLAIQANVFAQNPDIDQKVRSNEFGLDATAFFIQFMNINLQPTFTSYYVPTFYLTYRHYFKPGNIRAGLGGSVFNRDMDSPFEDDLNDYHASRQNFDFRLGWEFVSTLSKRWQAYYGLDFRGSIGSIKNDAVYWNGGYANGSDSQQSLIGAGPMLGFRFRLNDRLSLMTEASFSAFISNEKNRLFYAPVNDQFPPLPDENTKTKIFYTSFGQPVSLFFAFSF